MLAPFHLESYVILQQQMSITILLVYEEMDVDVSAVNWEQQMRGRVTTLNVYLPFKTLRNELIVYPQLSSVAQT